MKVYIQIINHVIPHREVSFTLAKNDARKKENLVIALQNNATKQNIYPNDGTITTLRRIMKVSNTNQRRSNTNATIIDKQK
jgi:hypothetical protein